MDANHAEWAYINVFCVHWSIMEFRGFNAHVHLFILTYYFQSGTKFIKGIA